MRYESEMLDIIRIAGEKAAEMGQHHGIGAEWEGTLGQIQGETVGEIFHGSNLRVENQPAR